MRFSLAVAVIVVGAGVSGLAQKNTYDAKPSDPLHVKQSSLLPAGKAGVGSSSAANARDLDAVQRQAAANSRASSAKASKVSSSTSKLTPIKEKSNPPIKFGAAGGAKSSGLTSQGADPYKGRVKQHKHQ